MKQCVVNGRLNEAEICTKKVECIVSLLTYFVMQYSIKDDYEYCHSSGYR